MASDSFEPVDVKLVEIKDLLLQKEELRSSSLVGQVKGVGWGFLRTITPS